MNVFPNAHAHDRSLNNVVEKRLARRMAARDLPLPLGSQLPRPLDMDTISQAQRSELMSRIRSKDTRPELVVRRILHRLGYRFRLHRKDLPGRPDIVLPRHKKVVLVHGCFWHGHSCRLASKPKSNSTYWSEKIARNKERDERNLLALQRAGWSVLELWECHIRNLDGLEERLRRFMTSE